MAQARRTASSASTSDRYSGPSANPAASAACGSSDVSVMPGATFTSRNHGVPSGSTTTSVRYSRDSPRASCARIATSAARAGTSSGSRAGTKYSVRPGLYRAS
jgi:hypothetical protein